MLQVLRTLKLALEDTMTMVCRSSSSSSRLIACLLVLGPGTTAAQITEPAARPSPATAASPEATANIAALPLYAIEIKIGKAWDPNKKPQDQAHFREHSAHLKRLRDQGVLVMGARYGDKGLVVLRAASESEAHQWMKDDPSMQAGVFQYELHPFSVFYSGTLSVPARRQP
jgi:uncharacterized protein YciI